MIINNDLSNKYNKKMILLSKYMKNNVFIKEEINLNNEYKLIK